MRHDEQWAGELLKTLLGAQRWVARGMPGAPDGTHDLDLLFDDGRRIAVEVKSHTSPRRAAFEAELEKINPISTPSLKAGWEVNIEVPDDGAKGDQGCPPLLKQIVPRLSSLLERIEAEDLHHRVRHMSGARGRDDQQEIDLVSQLRSLGVTHAYPASWVQPGTTNLRRTDPVTWFGSGDIAATVEEHIGRRYGSVQNAIEEGADEVHLLIWLPLGVTRSDATSAAVGRLAPGGNWPSMPNDMGGLDSVWVTRFSVASVFPELHGFPSQIWQFTDSGPYCWTLGWQRSEPGRPS